MLLQDILEKLDSELERLHKLREIVADLAHSPLRSRQGIAEKQISPELPPKAEPVRVIKRRASAAERPQRPLRARIAEAPDRALAAAIPSSPVVVSAAALAVEREARLASQRQLAAAAVPKPEKGSLGAMIEALKLGRPTLAS